MALPHKKHLRTSLILLILCVSLFASSFQVVNASSGISLVQKQTVPIITFEENSNYVRFNLDIFSIEFYKGTTGYNKLYDRTGGVLIYDDRLSLEYLFNPKQDTWRQRGTPVSLNWTKISDYTYEVNRYYSDFLGTTYRVRYSVTNQVGFASVKMTIFLETGQADTYRILWSSSGITIPNYVNAGRRLTFGSGLGAISFDWNDVYLNFGNITVSSISTVAQGKKADIYFNIGSFTPGQRATIDPITQVQTGNGYSYGGTSVSATLGATPTNGNLIVAVVGSPGHVANTIAQTGVTWTKQVSKIDHSQLLATEIWAGVVGSGASASLTATFDADTEGNNHLYVYEYSGLLTIGFLDKTADAGTTTSTATSSGTTATTAQASELWFAATMNQYASVSSNPTNGFTLDVDAGSNQDLNVLYYIASSTGTANTGCTLADSRAWIGCIVTLKAVSGTNYEVGVTVSTTLVKSVGVAWNSNVAASKALTSAFAATLGWNTRAATSKALTTSYSVGGTWASKVGTSLTISSTWTKTQAWASNVAASLGLTGIWTVTTGTLINVGLSIGSIFSSSVGTAWNSIVSTAGNFVSSWVASPTWNSIVSLASNYITDLAVTVGLGIEITVGVIISFFASFGVSVSIISQYEMLGILAFILAIVALAMVVIKK